jgi:predicted ribosomally synthesized peptide with nif11-like leader
MSIESAKAFIERMKTDSEFASKLTACVDAQARMRLVEAAGFDFTAEEMDATKRELTDRELNRFTVGWTLIDKLQAPSSLDLRPVGCEKFIQGTSMEPNSLHCY